MDLFEHQVGSDAPLADRMRPARLDEVVGQPDLLADGKLFAKVVRADRVPSMVLWGPPGTGKTTLANVIANETKSRFVPFSAVLGGVSELRKIIAAAKEKRSLYGERTVLFIDEIHRFNKSQQDALLPHVENGTVTLIGATTENPSFAVNSALLSRARVFELQLLEPRAVATLLGRAVRDTESGLGACGVSVSEDVIAFIAEHAQGDARRALNALELVVDHAKAIDAQDASVDDARQALAAKTLRYDKSGEEHYNVVSAFIKSMRGSDPDAAVYWMMRMLEAGDDPLFVLRRMLIFASEDVGNADPRALQVAVAADQAFHRLGMPEGMFSLSQCCIYLAAAPKSNASYTAWTAAQQDVREHGALPVPHKLRNAATSAMKEWGYGKGYRYPHSEDGFAPGETYLPEKLHQARYYQPTDSGLEARIKARLTELREKDAD